MSDIFSPIGRALPGIAGPTLITGVISDPPRALIGTAPGTILKGTVIGRGSDGLTAVATDKGTVNVATSAQLPPGSTVTLEVRNAGDRLQVLILSVDSQNTRIPLAQASTSALGGPSGTSTAGTQSSGALAGAALDTKVQPPLRPTPPSIEIVGSSVKAIVVQQPATTSLLSAPVSDNGPFLPPLPPTTVPPDAAQKAQLLVHTQLLLEAAAAEPLPNLLTPALAAQAAIPPGETPSPLATQASVAASGTAPSPTGSALQPEVAQRIAALFAAAETEQAPPAAAASTTATPAKPTGVQAGAPALGPLLAANLASTPAVALPAAAPRSLTAGTELTLHVMAVLPVKGGEIEIAPDAARLAGGAAPLIGRVLGYTRAGHPVIDTPAGLLMMQQKTRLPVGAQVALVLEPVTAPVVAPLPPITTPQQALLSLSSGWPTLEDLFSVLRGASAPDAAGAPPPPPGVPQTGPKLAAGLADAIAAFHAGDVERLLGPLLAGRRLPEGKDDAIKRLKDEFTQLSELAKDRPAVDWRAIFLPIYDPRVGLTQINLYYRHGSGADDPEQKERGTRFLIDVNFAALGAFQLDGLIRSKRFDLMIRSRRRLTQSQRHEIIGIFQQALEIGGCTGGLDFRTVNIFPVSPLDDLHRSHDQLTA